MGPAAAFIANRSNMALSSVCTCSTAPLASLAHLLQLLLRRLEAGQLVAQQVLLILRLIQLRGFALQIGLQLRRLGQQTRSSPGRQQYGCGRGPGAGRRRRRERQLVAHAAGQHPTVAPGADRLCSGARQPAGRAQAGPSGPRAPTRGAPAASLTRSRGVEPWGYTLTMAGPLWRGMARNYLSRKKLAGGCVAAPDQGLMCGGGLAIGLGPPVPGAHAGMRRLSAGGVRVLALPAPAHAHCATPVMLRSMLSLASARLHSWVPAAGARPQVTAAAAAVPNMQAAAAQQRVARGIVFE